MNIVIAAQFLGDIKNPETYNSRFLTIADMLVEKGHNVTIATTNFIHNKKCHIDGVTSYKKIKVEALNEPGYKKNVCLKRFWSHYVLAKRLKKWLENIEKPDVIYCAIPSLDFAYEAAKYAKKNNIKFIIDIQDLWPEAFEMVFNIPVIKDIIFYPLRKKANKVYALADEIVAVSKTYGDRALKVNKKCKQAHVVFLGTDLSKFDNCKEEPVFVKKGNDEIWLGYVGTLGHSYDIKTVIDSLDKLRDREFYHRLKFIVVGDGPLRDEFEKYADEKMVNVHFTGMLPYPQMVATLCKCDIAINPIVKNAAQSIINKHADYAAAGIPVISTQECNEYKELVSLWDMGYNCECENIDEIAYRIEQLICSNGELLEKGRNARVCAENKFNRCSTYEKIIEIVEKKEVG